MAYKKYYLQIHQVSYDNGLSWEDVTPTETRQGEYVDTYETLAECEGNIPYNKRYLTIESASDDNVIKIKTDYANETNTISASTDDGRTWAEYTSSTGGTTIATLNAGDKVLIKGVESSYRRTYFMSSGQFEVYGNIMSLLYDDNFSGQTALTNTYTFFGLFYNCVGLTSAENLVLPATTLAYYCYGNMFYGCTSLTTAPELPATTLTEYCYGSMFRGCTSLTTAPELSATTLADYCYREMFYDCTNLVNAPELPATTLTIWCYAFMFRNCTSLTTAPSLPATTLANVCYDYMFAGCTSLTTAPELPATTLELACYQSMFQGCRSLTTAPELPAATLVRQCYNSMFSGCTNLNYIKCLATDISASDSTTNWVKNVAATGTFVKDSTTTWTIGVNGIPNGWTVNDSSNQYLTIESLEVNNTIYFTTTYSANTKTISASTDNGVTWSTFTSTETGTTIATLNAGDKLLLKGNNSSYGNIHTNHFNASKPYNVYGNIMSLISGDSFQNADTLTDAYTFNELFVDDTYLYSAENLVLPATTLTRSCYTSMFKNCTNLTSAPELHATTLELGCYQNMFIGCTSLTTVPSLPATTLEEYCYYNMFNGCTSLTTAPSLPASTMAVACYSGMFYGCTNLTSAPVLSATTLASNCYEGMFRGCTSLTTAPSLPATTLTYRCYGNMFQGCTSLTTAPDLPALTLANQCYHYMFYNCSNLNYIKAMFTTTPSSTYTNYWVSGVAANGTFVKNSSATWTTTGVNAVPNGWTIQTA